MKVSEQDNYYLNLEGNSFFERNFENKNLPELRVGKQVILENIQISKIEFNNVLEYGCCYADLLAVLKTKHNKIVMGVEASAKAIEFSRARYNNLFPLVHGTISDNEINKSPKYIGFFDLVIIDDVFGWVSRDTLFQSLANIDSMVKDGGYIFIRDFFPDRRIKNRNHHVKNTDIFNFKVPGSHASLFIASGMYETIFQKIYYDDIGISTTYKCDNTFNYRWTDLILQKSLSNYYNESKKV